MTLDDLELENNLFSGFSRQYLAKTTRRCRVLTFASARLACNFLAFSLALCDHLPGEHGSAMILSLHWQTYHGPNQSHKIFIP